MRGFGSQRMLWILVSVLLIPGASTGSLPNPDLVCPPDTIETDDYTYLRTLSLDLRGTIPTLEEYAQVESAGEVEESLIDDWLHGEEFVQQTVRSFREIFWPNIQNFALTNFRTAFRRQGGSLLYWRSGTAATYRNAVIPCRDVEANTDTAEIETVSDGEGGQQEGYVWVHPYWEEDPNVKIKVCEFDAQAALVSPTGTQCGTNSGLADAGCGCGPDLRWCRYGSEHQAINNGFALALEKRIAAVIRDGLPYTDLFEDRRMWINGPMSHYLRYQIHVPRIQRMYPRAIPEGDIPVLPFYAKDQWVEIELPDYHAGVLTDPMFLLRFQTNRARATRFYSGFRCQPFEAPEDGIALDADLNPDLQQRAGCEYCHGQLEPAASYWGRWGEIGAGYLNPVDFPKVRDDCELCALTGQSCSDECRRYYLINALSPEEQPHLGKLLSYVFRDAGHEKNVEYGPKLLVKTALVDQNILPRCVATRSVERLLGRTLGVQDVDWIESLAVEFALSGYSYRELVKRIVMNPVYRRVQ